LNALLQRICDATGPALETGKVRLETSFDPNLPLIAGDADYLQQVFINLINNALDAMPEGGSLRVATAPAPADDRGEPPAPPQVQADVTDTGCGMSQETKAHIFDPLYTTKERGKGTGLGLVVVSHIMQEHGGAIEVESEPGRGTRFRLRFPALPGDAAGPEEGAWPAERVGASEQAAGGESR
jgi:signal transduction histidine kinase